MLALAHAPHPSTVGRWGYEKDPAMGLACSADLAGWECVRHSHWPRRGELSRYSNSSYVHSRDLQPRYRHRRYHNAESDDEWYLWQAAEEELERGFTSQPA